VNCILRIFSLLLLFPTYSSITPEHLNLQAAPIQAFQSPKPIPYIHSASLSKLLSSQKASRNLFTRSLTILTDTMAHSKKCNTFASTLRAHAKNRNEDNMEAPNLTKRKKRKQKVKKKLSQSSNNCANDMSNQEFDLVIEQARTDNHNRSSMQPDMNVSSLQSSVSSLLHTSTSSQPTTPLVRVVSMRLVNTPTTAIDTHNTLRQIQDTIMRLELQTLAQREREVVNEAATTSIPMPTVSSNAGNDKTDSSDDGSGPATPDSVDEAGTNISTPTKSLGCESVKSADELPPHFVARSASYPQLSIERKTTRKLPDAASATVARPSAACVCKQSSLLQEVDDAYKVSGSLQKQEDFVRLRATMMKIESLRPRLTPAQYRIIVQDIVDAYERGLKMVRLEPIPDDPVIALVGSKPPSRVSAPRSAPTSSNTLQADDKLRALPCIGQPVKLSVKLTDLEKVLHEEALLKPVNVLRAVQAWDDARQVSNVMEDRFWDDAD